MTINSSLLAFLESQNAVERISVPANIIVSRLGDECSNLVIVLEGQVKVYRPAENGKSITLYHIDKDESCILTASCIMTQSNFPAFAVTTMEVSALSVPLAKVTEWLKTEPLWQQYIFSLLTDRMVDLIELVNSMAFSSLDSRLASTLLDYDDACEGGGIHIPIKITHQEIADDLASSREVISRLLKKFESDSLIQLGRGELTILDRKALEIISLSM